MRFITATLLGLAAVAVAQSNSATSTSTSLSPQATCLAACGAADSCCQAACVGVPCPDELQANRTTECAARCPQGDGTQEQTEQYAACQSSCISSFFFSSGTAAPTATNGVAGTNEATATGASGSGASNSGPSATSSPNVAADGVHFGLAGVGMIGLIVAGLAL